MFPSKRARHNRNPDSLINHGTSAQSVRAEATEHRSGDALPRQPGTMSHRTLTRKLLLRPGLLALALAVVAVLSGILVGPAAATSQDVGARQPEVATSKATGSSEPSPPTTQTVQADPRRDQPPLIARQSVLQLRLDPARAEIGADEPRGYTATLRIRGGRFQIPIDVTSLTGFGIDPDGSCKKVRDKASCTAGEIGDYTVTATLPPAPSP
jgi:hypothetical protein